MPYKRDQDMYCAKETHTDSAANAAGGVTEGTGVQTD
jgi:hypothetical protein